MHLVYPLCDTVPPYKTNIIQTRESSDLVLPKATTLRNQRRRSRYRFSMSRHPRASMASTADHGHHDRLAANAPETQSRWFEAPLTSCDDLEKAVDPDHSTSSDIRGPGYDGAPKILVRSYPSAGTLAPELAIFTPTHAEPRIMDDHMLPLLVGGTIVFWTMQKRMSALHPAPSSCLTEWVSQQMWEQCKPLPYISCNMRLRVLADR